MSEIQPVYSDDTNLKSPPGLITINSVNMLVDLQLLYVARSVIAGGMFQGQELATSSKSKSCQMWRLLD